LYSIVARNAKSLGYNTDQVTTVTNAMATALKAAGASSQGAAATLGQFSQVLAKGRFEGDDFNTIMENLGPIMDIVAKNMGVTTDKLKQYVGSGLIGAKDFTDALIRSMGELDAVSGKSSTTLAQSLQRIQNSFASALVAIDNATGISEKFADFANKIAANGENLVPVIKAIGLALAALAVYAAPVVTLFSAAAAAALYFADIHGPILKPAVTAVETAIGGMAKVLGLFGMSGKKDTDKVTDAQKKLNDAAKNANTTIGQQPGQLTGVTKKYEEIVKQLKDQYEQMTKNGDAENINKKILEYKTALQGQMTAAQEKELRTLLIKNANYERTKQVMEDVANATKSAGMEAIRLNIQDLAQREQQAAIDQRRLELKRDLTAEEQAQVRAGVKQTQQNRENLAIDQARRDLAGSLTKEQAIQRSVGVVNKLDPNREAATSYKMDQDALAASLNAKLINEEQYQQALLSLKKSYADQQNQIYISQVETEKRQRETSIQAEQMRLGKTTEQARAYAEFSMKTDAEKAQFAINQGAEIFTALGAQNKKAFEAAKAFNIANAVMNTYMAVTKALASYPFPFSLIAAGGALAFGLAQVAQIRSQQYSGRQLGGPVMNGQSYIVGENGPEVFTPTNNGNITPNNQVGGGGDTNINFNIVANDAQGFDDLLLQRRGMITQMIVDARMEQGMRM
jgi:tape measure domain-containing protein